MRDGAQGIGAKIIVGIICFVLVVFGFGTFNFFTDNEPWAASINGDEITLRELEVEMQRQKRNLQSRMGSEADTELINNLVTQKVVLDSLINRALLRQTADDLDLTGMAESFREEIAEDPNFQVDGVFNESLYRSTLQNAGYSPQSFRDAALMLNQTRDVAYLIVDPSTFEEPVIVSDTEIEDFYQMHADQFVSEESFDLAYVEFSDLDERDGVDVSVDDVRSAYESAKSASESSDRRRASHILLELNEKRSLLEALEEMTDIRNRVLAGEDFAILATGVSEDPGSASAGGDLGMAGRGTFVTEFEDVLWSLAEGSMSSAFQTEFGVHLVKLTAIEAVEYPPFEEEQLSIRETLLTEQAVRLFEERLAAVDKLAFEETDSLEPIAEAYGLEIKTVEGLTRFEGVGLFESKKVRQGALEIDVVENGFNSRPILVEDTHAIVVRLVNRTLSKQLSLADVREQIALELKTDKADEQVLASINDALARLENEEPAGDVAARVGATWVRSEGATRAADDVPKPILREAFELAVPREDSRSVGRARLSDGKRAIVVVTNVTLGDFGATTESERTQLARQLIDFFGQRDFEGLMRTLRSDAAIETGMTVVAN